MKKIRNIILSIISTAALTMWASLCINAADGNELITSKEDSRFSYYTNSDGTLKVRASDSASFSTTLNIPSKLDGKIVTAIADRGFFAQKKLTKVVIPESVTKIGNSAFSNCDLLENVQIKGIITDIGAYPFFADPFEEKLKRKGDYVILNGDILYDYTGKSQNIEIPNGVRVVSGNLFTHLEDVKDFSITNITIPDSVEYICSGAFFGCNNIESVTMGSGLKSIGEDAFTDTDMTINSYYETVAAKYASDNKLNFNPLMEYGKKSETVYVEFEDNFRQYYFTDENELSREGVLVYYRNYNGQKLEVTDWNYSAKLSDLN